MTELRSDVYNALVEVGFRKALEGKDISKEEMKDALDWFLEKFYEEAYDEG